MSILNRYLSCVRTLRKQLKKMRLTLIFLIIGICGYAQNPDIISYDEISINGIDNQSSENDLISAFGKPSSITKPKYDCGALSADWNEVNVILYEWDGIKIHFVNGILEIGEIDYRKANPKIKTPQIIIDSSTTLLELQKAFPNSYKIWQEQNEKYGSKILSIWLTEFSDSEFHITIDNEKITKFNLYHPC